MQKVWYDSLTHHESKNISFHSNRIKNKFDNFLKANQVRLLNFEIEDLNIHLNYLRNKIRTIEESLFKCLPQELVIRFFALNKYRITSFELKTKNNSIKKLYNLKVKRNIVSPFSNIDKLKWLINISSKVIPDAVSVLLQA